MARSSSGYELTDSYYLANYSDYPHYIAAHERREWTLSLSSNDDEVSRSH